MVRAIAINNQADVIPPPLLRAVGKQLVVHVHPVEDTGIVIPDGVENPKQANLCTVLSAGPECKSVKNGDTVILHNQIMASWMFHKGYKYLVVHEENHVAGVIVEE